MGMNIINITPHTLNIHSANGVVTVEPSGTIARVATTSEEVGSVDGVPIYRTSFGDIEDLPQPKEGIVFVASLIVASRAAALGRKDVVSPGTLIRDDSGKPLGCRGLTQPSS